MSTSRKEPLGVFAILDACAISAIFGLLDVDSKLRFAVSCSAFSAEFSNRCRNLVATFGSSFLIACEMNSAIIAARVKPVSLHLANEGLVIACRRGNAEIAKIAISRGEAARREELIDHKRCGRDYACAIAQRGVMDLDFGLKSACYGGHTVIAEMMIGYGADDWNGGLRAACFGGYRDLVEKMIDCGATNWDGGLGNACSGGHAEIAEMMISFGATNWDSGLWNACCNGHAILAEMMINCGATDWNAGLKGACSGGSIELAERMIGLGADDHVAAHRIATGHGHHELAEILMERISANAVRLRERRHWR